MKQVLLITPPFTQLNTPYPATAYLKGFLNTKQIPAHQVDLGMEVIWRIFCQNGLHPLFETAMKKNYVFSDNAQRILSLKNDYLNTIDAVILFLQGKNPTLARQICQEGYLPEASRFDQLNELDWAFGTMGVQDKAKHLATLYLEDISDLIIECIDLHFGFSRYAERLGRSANSFDELYSHLQREPTFIDEITLEVLDEKIRETTPELVCFTVPFPGNLYSAFRSAGYIKKHFSGIKTCMGGGFANTELRDVKDPRVFDYFDFISLDDGELPIEQIITSLTHPSTELKRTFVCIDGKVTYVNNAKRSDYKQSEVGTPDYSDLKLDQYISVIEIANPMHSLWSDGRWNKLTIAHGCYWGKCTFCDISLDYIKLYEPIAARQIVDRMEQLIAQTGERGFHFVDEAAPPALMRDLAIIIIRRKLSVSWWTNIRFEKSFTLDLCLLLKASGCIAVSGGLEVASDRLLELIDKGVTVAQVAQVNRNFAEAGIMVHAYLMYGYPTQTIQETIDSLEMVRQMFECGILQSGFWHQFALTAHSPIGISPQTFGILPTLKDISFANNDIEFKDKTGINHDQFSFGLKKSLLNYMHGIGYDLPLHSWFDFKIPKTTIAPNYIERILDEDAIHTFKPTQKILWLGNSPIVQSFVKNNKGTSWPMVQLTFHGKKEITEVQLDEKEGQWLVSMLQKITPEAAKVASFATIKTDFELNGLENFELFWQSKAIKSLQKIGLIAV